MSAPIGNKFAAKAKEWEQALKRAMARKADGDFRATLDEIAVVVVAKALDGDKDAWTEIGNRLDGKPIQGIAGHDGGPARVIIGWMTTPQSES